MEGEKLMPNILIVEDDSRQRKMLKRILLREGYDAETAEDGRSALKKLKNSFFDLVITDVRMPGMTGKELLENIKKIDPQLPVVIVTAYGKVGDAVNMVVHKGAFYYLEKPIDNDQLKSEIKRALKSRDSTEEVEYEEESKEKYEFQEIIGKNPKMLEVFKKMRKIIERDANQVLIMGETGTGKELVAKSIHKYGHRSEKPFRAVNCSAITESLFESQLFGHEKGAFTGADSRKVGLFETANGGTVLLDDIGEVPIQIQTKLLRVIEERKFYRVGGVNGEPIKFDVCIIATTNADLEKAVQRGKFREDLYYRLNVVVLELPSLRERRGDIPLLVEYFLSQFSKEYEGAQPKKITSRAMSALRQYNWPGNVRQLENCLRQVFVLGESYEITLEDLPADISKTPTSPAEINIEIPESGISLEDVEKQYILAALRQTKGNQTQSAELLGITRRTLQYRIDNVYNIDIEDFK